METGPTDTGAPPRSLLVVAAALAVALAVVVAVLGLTAGPEDSPGSDGGPLALVAVPAPQSDTPHCDRLVEAVPQALESSGERLQRRELAEPAPPATVAWGGERPVVLRCGLDRPPELTRTASLREVNDVRWLPVPGEGTATWYVVDREVYVALTVPDGTGTGPLQAVSDTVSATLEPVEPRFD
ncbi:uncharacterized protein DUF3515 [Prauserella shujinwangii]|uniref:Uncharacterized protein DUF3515 n=1 Tax=Prauserella shujinwangii TaxID=1453103 RepID=A0A2T0LWC1_9PSEU|nr:DUF3515 domain-containing protein [Prauserella shujinwangii]PRX48314.1 uncharacterized protein DUF3515 [Prauserella shujinwangii]